jgi:hypothetical protein
MRMAQTGTDGKLGEVVDAARGLFRFVQEAAAQGSPIHEVERSTETSASKRIPLTATGRTGRYL